jgi:predicted MFS family arabinose efflux permease
MGSWRTSIDTDLLSALTLMAVVLSYRQLGMASLIALVFIAGGLRGLSHPARTVLLRPMIDAAGANVTRVTAIYDGIGRLTTLIGAPVGGLLLVWLSPLSVMAVDAATFALAALIVAAFVRMPTATAPTPEQPAAMSAVGTEQPAASAATIEQPVKESYLDSLRGGVDYLRRDRLILGVLLLLFIGNLATQAHQVVFIPLWVNERLGTPAGLGLVFGTFALGAVIGNLAFTAIAPRLPRYLTLTIGYLVGGAPRILVLAFTDSLPVVMVVLFLSGVALAAVNPIIGAVLYQRVPPSLQARVFGLASAFASAGLPIGSLLGGWVAQTLSLTIGLMVFGVALFAATLTPILGSRTWRELDDQSAPAGDSGGGIRLPAPLTITLAYAKGEWRLAAQQGRAALGSSRAIEPAEALRTVALLQLPEALAAAETIVEAERADAQREAERLRRELAQVEGRLAPVSAG